MFSSEVNTRDLYFSNPMDHFLGPEHEFKTSLESGFSSSYSGYNKTGNSKDSQYKNSQDLFNQTQRSDATDFQFGTSNTDYQKYISQNLLLGKEDSIQSLKQKDKEKETRKEKTLVPQNEFNDKLFEEIRNLLGILNESIQKISLEIAHQNGTVKSLQEEMSSFQEKVISTEQSIAKKVDQMKESYRNDTKSNKKEDEDIRKIRNIVSENRENIESLVCKLEDHIEQNDRKLLENIKKISKNYESINKKQLLNIQDMQSQTDDTVGKMNASVEMKVKDIQARLENMFEQKFNDLKHHLSNSLAKIYQLVSTPGIYKSNPSEQNGTQMSRSICDVNDIYANTSKKNSSIANHNPSMKYQANKYIIEKLSDTVSPKQASHTPLAKYTGDWETNHSENRPKRYLTRSRANRQVAEYKSKLKYTNLNIKRKVATPLMKSVGSAEQKFMETSRNSYCTPLIRSFAGDMHERRDFARKPMDVLQPQNRNNYTNNFESSMNSSPGLTVYQATTLAREYAFYTRSLKKK